MPPKRGGVGFGLIGYGSAFPHGRGLWLRIQRGDHFGELILPGRNSVVDGEVELPGYGSLPHTGTAIVWKHVKGGTFSLGDPANPVTGRFYCG